MSNRPNKFFPFSSSSSAIVSISATHHETLLFSPLSRFIPSSLLHRTIPSLFLYFAFISPKSLLQSLSSFPPWLSFVHPRSRHRRRAVPAGCHRPTALLRLPRPPCIASRPLPLEPPCTTPAGDPWPVTTAATPPSRPDHRWTAAPPLLLDRHRSSPAAAAEVPSPAGLALFAPCPPSPPSAAHCARRDVPANRPSWLRRLPVATSGGHPSSSVRWFMEFWKSSMRFLMALMSSATIGGGNDESELEEGSNTNLLRPFLGS